MLPDAQVSQFVLPALENVPAEHVEQELAPFALMVPELHGSQFVCPAFEYVPAKHWVQELAPAELTHPISHQTNCTHHLCMDLLCHLQVSNFLKFLVIKIT